VEAAGNPGQRVLAVRKAGAVVEVGADVAEVEAVAGKANAAAANAISLTGRCSKRMWIQSL